MEINPDMANPATIAVNFTDSVGSDSEERIITIPPGGQSILSTLNTARKQLPANEPGIIFVKVPEVWVRTQDIQTAAEEALGKFFRNTNRVGGLASFCLETAETRVVTAYPVASGNGFLLCNGAKDVRKRGISGPCEHSNDT